MTDSDNHGVLGRLGPYLGKDKIKENSLELPRDGNEPADLSHRVSEILGGPDKSRWRTAADERGVDLCWSDDFEDGRLYGRVKVQNPFRLGVHEPPVL